MRYIDNFLNTITMYRLVLYGLLVLAVYAVTLGFLGVISFSGFQLVGSLVILLVVCFFTNHILSILYKAPINIESWIITALILFFIIEPSLTSSGIIALVLSSILAIASKYVLAIGKKHIFNPAAISAVILGLFGIGAVSWWVAVPELLPFTAIVGLLIVRKIRRFQLFFSFLFFAIISIFIFQFSSGNSAISLFIELFTSWPLIFFATIMLTEPLTTPPIQRLRIIYSALVGILFGAQFQLGPIYSTPELALVIGNIYSYIVSPKEKLILSLKEKIQLSPFIYNFVFNIDQKFTFSPGQYLEWTIPLKRSDNRGNRRYFTIASSPTEKDIQLGVRFNTPGSTFKNTLLNLEKGDKIIASQLTGDFMLPKDKNQKLAFIAGGIGITPFRSIIKYLLDTEQKRDILLFYACSGPEEFVYKDIFEKAQKALGIKIIYIITNTKNIPANWEGRSGYLTDKLIKEVLIDFKEKVFYLSGPQKMVDSYKILLGRLGISKKNIVTDYFPGF